VFDIGILGRAHSRSCLLKLVRAFFPKIGDEKNAMRPFECGFERFGPV